MGLKADAEAERTVIDPLNNRQTPVEILGIPQGCRNPRCLARGHRVGSQGIPLRLPWAPGRSNQCAPGAPAAPGPRRASLATLSSARVRPPTQDKVQSPPTPGPPPPSLSFSLVPHAGLGASGALPRGGTEQRGSGRPRSAPSSPGRAMKVEFAPLNIPLARRLQTAAVLQWVLSFLLLGKNPARSRLRQIRVQPLRAWGLVRSLPDSPCPRTCLDPGALIPLRARARRSKRAFRANFGFPSGVSLST